MHPNDGRVVSNFIVQALTGEDITIYGEGARPGRSATSTTSWKACSRLMRSPDAVTGPINLGNPVETTILELAQKILALTDSRSRIVNCRSRRTTPCSGGPT